MRSIEPPGDRPDLSRLTIDRRAPGSAKPGRKAAGLFAAFIVLALTYFLGRSSVHEENRQGERAAEESVGTAPAAPAQSVAPPATVLNATGYVVAQRKAAVASKATGRLKALHVVEGDIVKQDEILAELENADAEADVTEAEAGLAAARAAIASAAAELREARRAIARAEKLRNSRVVSQEDLDEAVTRFEKAESAATSARANEAVAAARVEKAKVNLQYTFIRAPFDGTVLTKNADVGEIVAPFGAAVGARAAVVTLADMRSLEVEADVAEANLTKVYVGQTADIVLDSHPQKTYRGEVVKIVPTVDRSKATVLTKIRFLEIDSAVIPEMSAKITFQLRPPAPEVPAAPELQAAPPAKNPENNER